MNPRTLDMESRDANGNSPTTVVIPDSAHSSVCHLMDPARLLPWSLFSLPTQVVNGVRNSAIAEAYGNIADLMRDQSAEASQSQSGSKGIKVS